MGEKQLGDNLYVTLGCLSHQRSAHRPGISFRTVSGIEFSERDQWRHLSTNAGIIGQAATAAAAAADSTTAGNACSKTGRGCEADPKPENVQGARTEADGKAADGPTLTVGWLSLSAPPRCLQDALGRLPPLVQEVLAARDEQELGRIDAERLLSSLPLDRVSAAAARRALREKARGPALSLLPCPSYRTGRRADLSAFPPAAAERH